MYIHTYIHTYVHTYMHAYIHTYIHTYIPTYVHTYIQTDRQTYIHTYIFIPHQSSPVCPHNIPSDHLGTATRREEGAGRDWSEKVGKNLGQDGGIN